MTLANSYPLSNMPKKALFELFQKEYPYPDGIVDFLKNAYPGDYTKLRRHWGMIDFDEYLTKEYRSFLFTGRVKTREERMKERVLKTDYTSLTPGSFDWESNDAFITYGSASTLCGISEENMLVIKSIPLHNIDEIGTLQQTECHEDTPSEYLPKQEEQQGEEKMYFHFDTRTPLEQQQIDFAFAYARSAVADVKSALRTKFNMCDDPAPKTAEEFIERIKTNKYTLLDKETDGRWRSEFGFYDEGDMPRRIVWRAPDRVKDEDGYNAAIQVVDDEWTKLQTVIMAGDYNASIAAVDAFSKKYAA